MSPELNVAVRAILCSLVLCVMFLHDAWLPKWKSIHQNRLIIAGNKHESTRTNQIGEQNIDCRLHGLDSQDQLDKLLANDYSAMLNAIRVTKEQIWNDWDVSNYPLFLSFMHIPDSSWERQLQKFYDLLVISSNDRRLPSFVVGFTGSSITAGHDNYFHEAYPSQFYQKLASIFDIIGVNLTVRNAALGNNPCYPYDMCTSTHVGDDIDLLAWEQSMNCGRDPRPVETLIRDAYSLPKQPSLLFLLSGTPGWSSNECNTSVPLPLSRERRLRRRLSLDMESFLLNSSYREIANSTGYLHLMTFLKPSKLSNHPDLAINYASIAPMGQNLLGLGQYKCMGPYGPDFSLKANVNGATWHPGKMGHKLRADNLSFFLLSILEDAIKKLMKTVTQCQKLGNTVQSKTKEHALVEKSSTKAVLPLNPIYCDAAICSTQPYCYTNFQPRVKNSLSGIIVDSSAALTSLRNESWRLELSFLDTSAVAKAVAKGYGYLDRKFIYVSYQDKIPLSFRLTTIVANYIWLCEVQKGFAKYPSTMGDLDKAAEVFVDLDVEVSADFTPSLVNEVRLVPTSDQCYRTLTIIPSGQHVLSVQQKNSSQQINLAYLVHW